MMNPCDSSRVSLNTSEQIFFLYPELSKINKSCWFKLIKHSQKIHLPPQTFMQTNPGPYEHFLLILEGQSRAYQVDENGREVTLYRNFPGNICPDNLHALFSSQSNQYRIKAETAIHAIQISSQIFHEALNESDVFRNFIFSHLSKQFSDLTIALQETTFEKLDSRLCNLLKKLFIRCNQDALNITHQNLANELGTTREVISRSLKLLEKKGCLKINRGQLIMINPRMLTNL